MLGEEDPESQLIQRIHVWADSRPSTTDAHSSSSLFGYGKTSRQQQTHNIAV